MPCPSQNTTDDGCNIQETIIQPLVSEHTLYWLRMILLGCICQPIALFGVTTNVINFLVYIKLGVKEPMNVSLIGLSISDFISCFSQVFFNLFLFPPFMELDLPFRPKGAHYLFAAWPHIVFVKVTTFTTAFITIERCLCVTYPLKVKQIITTKRVTCVIVFFFVLSCALAVPVYYVNYFDWVFSPERNRTLYTLMFREERAEVEGPLFFVIGIFFPTFAFVGMIVSTYILLYKLKQNAKWRQGVTGNSSADAKTEVSSKNQLSSRDAKVTKMVTMISALFLISFTPIMVSTYVMLFSAELKEGGARENLLHLIFYFNYLLETTNASLNIFIYYFMSSNYKKMFMSIFKMKTSKN